MYVAAIFKVNNILLFSIFYFCGRGDERRKYELF